MKFLDIAGLRKFLALLLTKVVAAINEVANKVTNIEGDYLSKSNGGTVDGETYFNGKTHFAENVFLNDNLDAGNHDIKNVKNLYVAQSLHSEKNLYTGKIQPNTDDAYQIGDYNLAYKKIFVHELVSEITGASPILELANTGPAAEVVIARGYINTGKSDRSTESMNIGIYKNNLMAKYKYRLIAEGRDTEIDLLLLNSEGNSEFPGTIKANKFIGILDGNADSATKLNTSAGSVTKPIYFNGGKPVACTHELNATVPSNAKFTDTVYTHPNTSGNKHIPSGGKSGQILRWSADGTAAWGADNMADFVELTAAQLTNLTT